MISKIACAVAVAAATSVASAQLNLRMLGQVDVSNAGIGNNPASVAWNGTDLYVGGHNNTGGVGQVGIVRVQDALGAANIGAAFGLANASAFTGYEYMDSGDGNTTPSSRVFTSWTDAGTNSVRGFDGLAGTQLFDLPQGGTMEGIAFDRRFGGRVTHVQRNSGFARRDLPDGSAASDVVIFNGALGTGWRGIDIDSNGNLFVRTVNATARYATGDGTPNSGVWNSGSPTILGTGGTGQGLNIAGLNNTGFGDFAIWNDRGAGSLESLLNASDYAGVAQALSIDFNGFTVADSNTGWYDFSYDLGTNTLAISDFSNRQVYIFGIVPTPSTAALMGFAGIAAARRRR